MCVNAKQTQMEECKSDVLLIRRVCVSAMKTEHTFQGVRHARILKRSSKHSLPESDWHIWLLTTMPYQKNGKLAIKFEKKHQLNPNTSEEFPSDCLSYTCNITHNPHFQYRALWYFYDLRLGGCGFSRQRWNIQGFFTIDSDTQHVQYTDCRYDS